VRYLTAAVLALSVLTAPAAAAGSSSSTIAWGPCSDQVLAAAGAQCGTLDVPLDHSDPAGKKITLAVSRLSHKTTVSQGTLLTVPDPFTGNGYRQSLLGSRLPNSVGDSYDWVGFARRGLAPSVPAISCVPDHIGFNRPNYVPTTAAIEQQWLQRTQAYADACAAKQPELLDHLKTTDTVADMELVRDALGAQQVTLFAQAYGTYVAQAYSTLHPERVPRMVLDSSVDPRRVWYNAAAFDVDVPLERNLKIWFSWVAQHDSDYHLGTTVSAVNDVWDEQLRRVSAAPAAGVIGQTEWTDLFLFVPYSQQTWPLLGSAFANWVHNGDGETLKALFSLFYLSGSDNVYGALMAEVCTDTAWPADWNQWRWDSWVKHAQAPNTTWGNTWFNAPCFFWHAKPGKPVQVDGSRVDSALLVDQTLDAATPFEGSLEVRARYPRAALIAERGGTTNAGALSGNACVDSKIAAYLATGELPARRSGRRADVECDALPQPNP
jgi:pimeloyl-ACP methyl ester carboxylesterase